MITGASRGLGKGFLVLLLQRPNTTVIAAIRNPAKFTAELEAIPKASGAKLIIVKLDGAIDSDAALAVQELQTKHNITSLDVVVANAAIADPTPILENDPGSIREHFQTNAIAPLQLLKATKPLLQASKTGSPSYIAISSIAGSIEAQELITQYPIDMSPYGASKAALNWFVRRAHFEEKWLTTVALHPGYVLTDLAPGAADDLRDADLKDQKPMSPENSAGSLLEFSSLGHERAWEGSSSSGTASLCLGEGLDPESVRIKSP